VAKKTTVKEMDRKVISKKGKEIKITDALSITHVGTPKGTIPVEKKNNGFDKARKGRFINSLQRHDEFFAKHSAQIEKMFKGKARNFEIAKTFEKEAGGLKQSLGLVYYSLNRLDLIHTKNAGALVKRHEALRKELKNGK
jgi:hypothetical protein